MSLRPGTRLGPYEIVLPLGAGGMGEVYRAHDTRLGRDVAIKVVVSSAVADPVARARFDREARAVAALNHPNVCALYDVGEEAGRQFFVMELLDGETLQYRLARGALDSPTLIPLVIDIADALDAAHRRGVIHRDLKPANLFLTRHGQVKILDFGLAKGAVGSEDTTQALGFDSDPGVTAGTVAYMSPEQLRGQALDARTDVFSLGLVLYELSVGRRAFEGTTSAALAAAILTEEPTAPRVIRPELAPKLEEIILKAIDKDRELRYQSAGELRADLKRLQRESSAKSHQPPTPLADGRIDALRSSTADTATISDGKMAVSLVARHSTLAAVVALSVLAAISAGAYLLWRGTTSTPDLAETAASDVIFQTLTFDKQATFPAITPDGRFVAYRRDGAIWVRQIGLEHEVEVVPAVAGRSYQSLTVTPTGDAVDFVISEGGAKNLWRVPLLGGSAKLLARDVWSAVGWSPDGKMMAFVRTARPFDRTSVVIAESDGGRERVVAERRLPIEYGHNGWGGSPSNRPAWSLDGSHLIVVGGNGTPDRLTNPVEWVTIGVQAGKELSALPLANWRGYIESTWGPALWLDTNRVLVEARDLWITDPAAAQWTKLTRDTAHYVNVTMTADRRTAVATRAERRTGIWLAGDLDQDPMLVVPEGMSSPRDPVLDRDGTLYYSARAGESYGIYRVGSGNSRATLVVGDVLQSGFSVAPNGRAIVYTGSDPPFPLYRSSMDGTAPVKLVARNAAAPVISADGREVLFSPHGPGLLAVSINGGEPRQVTDRMAVGAPRISPDGRRIMFATDKPEVVFVCEWPECTNGREIQLSQGVAATARWSPDGLGIAYVASADQRNIWVQPFSGGPARPTTKIDRAGIQSFGWSPDGTRLALERGGWHNDLVLIKGLR